MADSLYSDQETAIPLLRPPEPRVLSKRRLQLLSRLICLFGLLLVFGTLFASLQIIEICSTSLNANFCS